MAVITEDIQIEQTFDLNESIDHLFKRIMYAKNMHSRRYIFIGEMHTNPFDQKRTIEIATRIVNDPDIIGIVERKIFDHLHETEYRKWSQLAYSTNFRYENIRYNASSTASRNTEAVTLAIEEIEKDHATRPHQCPRPVVIFFGQEHERPLRREFEERLRSEPKICWWSCRSITEKLGALALRTEADLNAPYALGFADNDRADPHMKTELLRRGVVVNGFNLPVFSSTRRPRFAAGVMAVYVERARFNTNNLNLALYDSGRYELMIRTFNPQPIVVRALTDQNFGAFHGLVAQQETAYANS